MIRIIKLTEYSNHNQKKNPPLFNLPCLRRLEIKWLTRIIKLIILESKLEKTKSVTTGDQMTRIIKLTEYSNQNQKKIRHFQSGKWRSKVSRLDCFPYIGLKIADVSHERIQKSTSAEKWHHLVLFQIIIRGGALHFSFRFINVTFSPRWLCWFVHSNYY